MPKAQVVVHHRGARHLRNPQKLLDSVVRVQGEAIILKYGAVVPIEPHRLQVVHDGDTIGLDGKQTLRFIDAPGHAPHELCIYETRNGGLFSGDAAGVRVADSEILLPVTPPPSFDLELTVTTIEKLIKLEAAAIYFSHFGMTNEVQENLQLLIEKLRVWDNIIAKAVEENAFDSAAERLITHACADLEPMKKEEPLYEYLINWSIPMSAAGFARYYQTKL